MLYIDRLDNKVEWAELLCARPEPRVGMACDENDRNIPELFNSVSRFDTIEITSQPNIHQNDVRLFLPSSGNGRIASSDGLTDHITGIIELHLQAHGDHRLVFDK